MARRLDKKQLDEFTAFLAGLFESADFATDAEWARESGVHPVNLSDARTGKGQLDGYNLLRLIRAAAARSGQEPAEAATALASAQATTREAVSDRLQAVEAGLTDLASEVRRAIEQQALGERRSGATRRGRSQGGHEA